MHWKMLLLKYILLKNKQKKIYKKVHFMQFKTFIDWISWTKILRNVATYCLLHPIWLILFDQTSKSLYIFAQKLLFLIAASHK